jgi:hypothetical protein
MSPSSSGLNRKPNRNKYEARSKQKQSDWIEEKEEYF